MLIKIEQYIHVMRGHRVMLDEDLARIYGVSTKRLNQQVRRNRGRFPADFLFQLTKREVESLRLQNATLERSGRGHFRKYLPYAFTEHGAVMVSAVLNTPIAIEASIQIARAFVRLRRAVSEHKELAAYLAALERKVAGHDQDIQQILETIQQLISFPDSRPPKIGFVKDGKGIYRVLRKEKV